MWRVYRYAVVLLWLLFLLSGAIYLLGGFVDRGHMPSLIAVLGMFGWLLTVFCSGVAFIWGIILLALSLVRKSLPALLDVGLFLSVPIPAGLVLLYAPLK